MIQENPAWLNPLFARLKSLPRPAIVAGDSTRSVLTTAALLRLLGPAPSDVPVLFTNHLEAGGLLCGDVPDGSQFLIVDLIPVPDDHVTWKLVKTMCCDGADEIAAIIDGHDRETWKAILEGAVCGTLPTLDIQPQGSWTHPYPSAQVLWDALWSPEIPWVPTQEESQIRTLLTEAQMDWARPGSLLYTVHRCTFDKDNQRRQYLARMLALHLQPEVDMFVQKWLLEYEDL